MKTYIVDFGEKVSGGRYAIVKAKSIDHAFLSVDCAIDSPVKIAEFNLPKTFGLRYIEIEEPKERYCGNSFECFDWVGAEDL